MGPSCRSNGKLIPPWKEIPPDFLYGERITTRICV
jgi:hypothetical protein